MVSYINKWIVGEYSEAVKDQEGIVLLSIEDLSVEDAQNLRNEVRSTGAALVVGKKRLVRVALKEAGVELDDSAWDTGNTALLVGDVETTIAAAKAIEGLYKKVKKEERKVTYRGAFLDGTVMNASEAAGIAGMPDRHTLRTMLVSTLAGPARKLATVLNEVGASTARAMQARADQEDAA